MPPVDRVLTSPAPLQAPVPRSRGPLRGAMVVVGMFLLAAAFALAAPLGSAPDEPDHWRYAWGALTGQAVSTGAVNVPASLVGYPGSCFNERPATGAACAQGIPDDRERVDASTSALLYPTLYYRVTGWPLLLSPSTPGLLGARLVSAAVSAVFWGLAVAPWFRRGGWVLRVGVLLAATPSALYFAGMISPQGLELASLAAAWSLTLRVLAGLRQGSYRDLPAWVQVAWPATLAVACMTRVVSWWWVAVVVVACWIAVRPPARRVLRDRRALVALGAVAVVIVARAGIFLVRSFLWDVTDSLGTPVDLPLWQLAVSSVWRALDDPADAVGLLGWLDTDVPSAATGVWFVLFGGLVGLVAPRVRARHLAACAVTAAALLGTWIVLDPYLTQSGGIPFWQPRYGLGVAIGIPILLAGASLDRPLADPPRFARVVTAWAVAAGWTLALAFLLVRYMWSADWFGPVGPPTWSPYLPSYILVPVALLGGALAAGSVAARSGAQEAASVPEPVVPAAERPRSPVEERHG